MVYFLQYEFARFYFASATNSAFQNLYDDKDGIRQSFGAFWQLVAKNFGKYSNVMGYELLNEPVSAYLIHNIYTVLSCSSNNRIQTTSIRSRFDPFF
jgi:aryl-phospho-beta-D-glucosidase BglC (GH1 family)